MRLVIVSIAFISLINIIPLHNSVGLVCTKTIEKYLNQLSMQYALLEQRMNTISTRVLYDRLILSRISLRMGRDAENQGKKECLESAGRVCRTCSNTDEGAVDTNMR